MIISVKVNRIFERAQLKLNGDRVVINYIELIQEYINLQFYKKDVISKAQFDLIPLLNEVEKRINIREIVYFMTNEEIIKALLKGIKDPNKFIKRVNGYAIISENGSVKIITDKEEIYKKLYELVPEIKAEMNLPMVSWLRGNIASIGKAIGRAVIVNSIEDISKVKMGDILISPTTTPDYTPALNKVAAIITDEGGVLCHAAIMAREFGIPCITGTKIGTKFFKDGDSVLVDANNGICNKLP
jgi:phosphoenolpyruvate synthase/pyruvate phosphate dikinase